MENSNLSIKRNQEGMHVYYDIQSSHGPHYHQVEMLGPIAISCSCKAGKHKQPCEHKPKAEQTEQEFLNALHVNLVEDRTALGLLNGDRSFSLLKK